MFIKDLSTRDLAARLGGAGVRARMGPFIFAVKTRLSELVEPLRLLYAHYPIEEGEGFTDFEVAVAPRSRREKWLQRKVSLIIDGEATFEPFHRRIALPMLEWAVNWCVFTRPHQYLILHAAVLERGGLGLILPGQPGAGKSTLCAGLSLRGWRLLSDEVAMMRPPSIDLVPVPRPVGLKEGSIDVIKRFDPAAAVGPSTPGTRKGTVAHVQVGADAVARGQQPAKPRLIVFPRWQAGAELTLEPYPKAVALIRIGQDAFNYSILGAAGFETLAALVDAVDCYTLTYSDMNEAIARLNDLIAQAPAQERDAA